jgi:hypothetical protein
MAYCKGKLKSNCNNKFKEDEMDRAWGRKGMHIG